MVLKYVCLLPALFGVVSAVVYAISQHWSEAGESVYISVCLLILSSIAKKDYDNRMARRVRR